MRYFFVDFSIVIRYYGFVIKSFKNAKTAAVFSGNVVKGLNSALFGRARQRLEALDAITEIEQLSVPAGNDLKPLRGNWAGFWSIRVNDQYRIRFRFDGANAYDVQLGDFHD